MFETMTHVMLFVRDYDEALDFYSKTLDFEKVTDVSPMPGFRFLTVAPQGKGTEVVLHMPSVKLHGEAEAKRMSDQIGKASPLMFKVDDCRKSCEELRAKGVKITKEPGPAPFGIQASIMDLYGNTIWLIEHPK